MFSGFKSRWMILFLWRYVRADAEGREKTYSRRRRRRNRGKDQCRNRVGKVWHKIKIHSFFHYKIRQRFMAYSDVKPQFLIVNLFAIKWPKYATSVTWCRLFSLLIELLVQSHYRFLEFAYFVHMMTTKKTPCCEMLFQISEKQLVQHVNIIITISFASLFEAR